MKFAGRISTDCAAQPMMAEPGLRALLPQEAKALVRYWESVASIHPTWSEECQARIGQLCALGVLTDGQIREERELLHHDLPVDEEPFVAEHIFPSQGGLTLDRNGSLNPGTVVRGTSPNGRIVEVTIDDSVADAVRDEGAVNRIQIAIARDGRYVLLEDRHSETEVCLMKCLIFETIQALGRWLWLGAFEDAAYTRVLFLLGFLHPDLSSAAMESPPPLPAAA